MFSGEGSRRRKGVILTKSQLLTNVSSYLRIQFFRILFSALLLSYKQNNLQKQFSIKMVQLFPTTLLFKRQHRCPVVWSLVCLLRILEQKTQTIACYVISVTSLPANLLIFPQWQEAFGFVTRVYVPRFFVSSQQRFGATDIKALGASQLSWTNRATALRQISVTALFYL